MSERFERVITFGPPPVVWSDRETWTELVQDLYERLKSGDCTALAPLLDRDIEFIRDAQAIRALVNLKYDPLYPPSKARAELRKIGNIISRRPGTRRRLPFGDRLHAELESLTRLIKELGLLNVKKDPKAIRSRLESMRPEPKMSMPAGIKSISVEMEGVPRPHRENSSEHYPEQYVDTLHAALEASVRPNQQYVRSARSWALNALANHYRTEPKQIEKAIQKDLRSGRRKR